MAAFKTTSMSARRWWTSMSARRWWPTAALVLVGGLVGLGYGVLAPPTYTATAYVLVVAETPGDSSSAVSYAQAYTRLARQGEVVASAIAASRGTISVEDLRRNVRASSSPDAPVIEVSGSAGDAQRAANMANLVADSLVSVGRTQAPSTRMNLVLLSPAYPPPDPSSPRLMLSVAVGTVIGLLLGGLVLLTRPMDGERGSRGADRTTGLGPGRRRDGGLGDATPSRRTNSVLADSP